MWFSGKKAKKEFLDNELSDKNLIFIWYIRIFLVVNGNLHLKNEIKMIVFSEINFRSF